MTKEATYYIVCGCVVWALIGLGALRHTEWWYRKKPKWKKYFEDLEEYRLLKRSKGIYTNSYDFLISYKFNPDLIEGDIKRYCDSWCTPDIFLNLSIIAVGGLSGIEKESKDLAMRNLRSTGIKEFKFGGLKIKSTEE